MCSAVDTLMLKPASPRRSPAPAHTASATSRAGAASLPRCAASPAFRSCGPTTPSTAPPGSRGPRVEPDISSSSPAASHGRGGTASTRVPISTGRPEEPDPSLSDDDGRAAAYRHDRTVTCGGNRSVVPVWTCGRANRTLALSTASTGRCPLCTEGARTGSARCSTMLVRLP